MTVYDANGRAAPHISKTELVWTNERLMEDMKAMARRLQALEPLVCAMVRRHGAQKFTQEYLNESMNGDHGIKFVIEGSSLIVQPAAVTTPEPKPEQGPEA